MKPQKPQGKIIIPSSTNIWPHELAIAKILAVNGYKVEFIRKSNNFREHSADALINGEKWEFKSPRAHHTRTILKNLKKAHWQSDKVVLDSSRIKQVPNNVILRETKKAIKDVPEISRLKYISKTGEIVDIK